MHMVVERLLDAIAALIREYVALPTYEAGEGSAHADAIALWVLHAHAHDVSFTSPLLASESPQKRCGKTRALEITSRLTPRSIAAANISSAALFRVVERDKPTLFIDEGDAFLKTNEELRGILNSGQTRTSAFVIRVEEVDGRQEPRTFSTWAPKAIALIGELPDTLQDRTIVIELRRKLKNETIKRFRADRTGSMTELARMAARWVADNERALRDIDPETPYDLHDRAADNWRPLLSIADVAGGLWSERARKAASHISGDKDGGSEEDPGIRMLADCRHIFSNRQVAALTPAALLDNLLEMEGAPWPEWRHGKSLTVNGLAKLLKPFRIRSTEPTRAFGPDKKRYYQKRDFEDSWARYIPATDPEKPSQPSHPSQAHKTPCETTSCGGTDFGAQPSQKGYATVPPQERDRADTGRVPGRDACGTDSIVLTVPEKSLQNQPDSQRRDARDGWDGNSNGSSGIEGAEQPSRGTQAKGLHNHGPLSAANGSGVSACGGEL
jgi:putative DNA primase/helicase